jgi:Co/Zn/Cd efflux system component
MFGVELGSSLRASSVSLLADSVDFLSDAGNFAVSLFVLGMATVWRLRAAYAKGVVMGAFGVLVLACARFGHAPATT